MAEVVQWHIEQMLPELEQMQRVGLFTHQEIKTIVQKRKELEYRIRRRVKKKEDFLKYVHYEVALLKLLQKRRKRIGYQHKKNEIDSALRLRVKRIFQHAVYRYQSDVELWMEYIKFLKELNWKSMVSRAFVRMLAVHSDKPDIWVAAAEYEYETNNMSAARTLMLRALRYHPDCHKLFIEYFRLELQYAEQLRERYQQLGLDGGEDVGGEAKHAVMEGRLAVAVYESALTSNCKPELLVGFLAVSKQFEFTKNLQELIVSSLREKFPCSEVTWDTIARMELEDKEGEEVAFKERIKRCYQVYEDGLEKLEGSSRMWDLYLDTAGSVYEKKCSRKQRGALCRLYSRAADSGMLNVDRYVEWMKLLTEDLRTKEALDACDLGLKAFPEDGRLWKMSVEVLLTSGHVTDWSEVFAKFREALPHIRDVQDAMHLWKELLKWLGKTECPIDSVQHFFDEATTTGNRELLQELRALYMIWASENLGNKAAWKLFVRFCNRPPFSLQVHWTMLDLEKAREAPKKSRIEKVFNSASEHFGQTSTAVWLKWMEWEETKGNAMNSGNVYQRAMSALQAHLVDDFVTQCTLKRLAPKG